MHELGIVFYIIDECKKVAAENDVKHIRSVTVEIGEVSGVIPSYFKDVWKWAVNREELTHDCELKLIILQGISYCETCGKTLPTVEYGKKCPHCGSDKTYLVTGQETSIKEMEVD